LKKSLDATIDGFNKLSQEMANSNADPVAVAALQSQITKTLESLNRVDPNWFKTADAAKIAAYSARAFNNVNQQWENVKNSVTTTASPQEQKLLALSLEFSNIMDSYKNLPEDEVSKFRDAHVIMNQELFILFDNYHNMTPEAIDAAIASIQSQLRQYEIDAAQAVKDREAAS